MVAKQTVKDTEFQFYSLVIQPIFWDTLQEILDFTLNQWGTTVMYEFLKKINQSILSLNTTPHIYAKCLHLISTETKTHTAISKIILLNTIAPLLNSDHQTHCRFGQH